MSTETVHFRRRWNTVAEVAEMRGFGETKVRMAIISGDLKSIKDGKLRRILPEWVDQIAEVAQIRVGQRGLPTQQVVADADHVADVIRGLGQVAERVAVIGVQRHASTFGRC